MSGQIDLAALSEETVTFDGGGLGRKLSVYRLPETDWSRHLSIEHTVAFQGGADCPVYVRITQADGHQALVEPDLPHRLRMAASATVRENPIELLEPRSHSVVVSTADDNWACDEVIE